MAAVPQIEGLTVEAMLELAKTSAGALRHLPDERYWDGLNRKWVADILYTVERAKLEKAIKDYQGRSMILAPDARAQEEQKLGLQQQTFERTYMQYQQEMQQTYGNLLGDLDEKMRTVAATVGKEQACTVVLDRAVVVYAGADFADVTTLLVAKYNQTHPGGQ